VSEKKEEKVVTLTIGKEEEGFDRKKRPTLKLKKKTLFFYSVGTRQEIKRGFLPGTRGGKEREREEFFRKGDLRGLLTCSTWHPQHLGKGKFSREEPYVWNSWGRKPGSLR